MTFHTIAVWPPCLISYSGHYLNVRDVFSKLIMCYKVLNGLVDINITLTTSTHGHSHRFATHFARTDTYLNPFLPSTLKLWNSLPDPLTNFDQFKDFPLIDLYAQLSVFIYSFWVLHSKYNTIQYKHYEGVQDQDALIE